MAYTYTDKIKFAYTPNFDAFNRLRVSQPLTLFDSSNRFRDSEVFATSTSGTAAASFNSNQGLVDLIVGTANGSSVLRETYRTFSYQPGKSLLVMNTFTLEPAKANLRQRVGYFGDENGLFLEVNNNDVSLVKRSSVTGLTVDSGVLQSNWNVDTMNGNGPSGITLDLTKSQILWCDLEWLGVGSVRMGFVVNGELITCHVFHHANIEEATYMTTACLPIRYEITNTGITSTGSTLKQICSTVISEGGYELRGEANSVGTDITSPYAMTSAGIYYPIISLRLAASRLDGIAVPTGVAILPNTAGNYSYKLLVGGTTSGGSWISAGANSIVEYNITGTSISGGRTAFIGFLAQTNQSTSSVELNRDDLFRFQLQRDSFTSTPLEFTLCVASNGGGDSVFGSIDWQEITR